MAYTNVKAKSKRVARWVLLGLLVIGVLVPYAISRIRLARANRDNSEMVAALRAYRGAQEQFRKEDRYGIGLPVFANPVHGSGFPDLHQIGGPGSGGELLGLIPREMALATTPAQPYRGYYFVDIVKDWNGDPYDYVDDCGLCAVPADYPASGRYTFIIDLNGTVFPSDNGGKPMTRLPQGREWDDWMPSPE